MRSYRLAFSPSVIATLALGLLIALCWITAARGGIDLPREAVAWLSGRKPNAVSTLYDALIWTGLIALFASAILAIFLRQGQRQ